MDIFQNTERNLMMNSKIYIKEYKIYHEIIKENYQKNLKKKMFLNMIRLNIRNEKKKI